MSEYLEQQAAAGQPVRDPRPARASASSCASAVERGRATRPDLKLGICGEHGGDPASVAVLRRGRSRLRVVLALPRADRPPRRRPRRARRRRPRHHRVARVASPRSVSHSCVISTGRVNRDDVVDCHTASIGSAHDRADRARARPPRPRGRRRPSSARRSRRREEREAELGGDCSRRARPARSAPGTALRPEEPDPLPALLRARPRPGQALAAVAAPRRQVPGVHRPRGRPSPHPAHPRGRGRAGGHRHRPGRQPVPPARRGDRARPRLRPRARRPRLGGGVLAVPARHRLRPRGLRRRRHARAAQPLRRDARRRAQPLVAPPGARHARGRGGGLGRPHRVRVPRLRGRGAGRDPRARRPARRRCATSSARRRSEQIGTFMLAVLDAIDRTGARRDDRAGGRRRWPRSGRSTSSGSTCGPRRAGRPRA